MVILKIPYRLKKKKFTDLPVNYQNEIKETVLDYYSDRYDTDSKEIRFILKKLESKTAEEIEKELKK